MSRISIATNDGTTTISIHGSFVFDLNREFRDAYQDLPAGQPFAVDLCNAGYIDSAGLGMLLRLREHAGNDKRSVTLVGANDRVRTILDIANFGQLFTIV